MIYLDIDNIVKKKPIDINIEIESSTTKAFKTDDYIYYDILYGGFYSNASNFEQGVKIYSGMGFGNISKSTLEIY
jgi:hypothetical protein